MNIGTFDYLKLIAIVCLLTLTGCSGCNSHSSGVTDAGSSEAKEVTEVEVAETDRTIQLNADNAEVKWSCANALGQVQVGYFYELEGKAVVDASNVLKQLDIEFNMKEVKANALSLSTKLQGPGFFQTDQFPTATFTSTSITSESLGDAPAGTTHLVEANLQMRDVTKSITIPVAVELTDDNFKLNSEFKINRHDFGVVHPVSLEDKAIQDDVVLAVGIDVGTAVVADETPKTKQHVAVDLGDRYTEEIPVTLVQFDMIRVPGDDAGIKPFYLGKCEVTWEEFDYWALCKDKSEKQAVMLRNGELRPSAPHDLEATYRGWGREGQPAIGVSKKAVELYCEWLSKQTGKHYRLPTLAEWRHAYELGGGDPSEDDLPNVAWFEQNSLDDEGFDNRAMKVATREPNKLGIYDMLGNASEWVADEPVVVGGNFFSMAEDLSASATEQEDQNVWNATYPQIPKSIWWYKDADYVGFRIACDAE
ncbi:MAG: SUMF1/EgtB/PvdO family nonheme iron enzyme [Planctomycetales bacterium]|nr:SUMF1/EgtB/PvdO family nonheme iron enzyme [Planctomycetales bacterium]